MTHILCSHHRVFSFSLSPALFSLYQPCLKRTKGDNLETDPNSALQSKDSLCVILASCMLSICSTANFAKAQNSPVEANGWQTVLLLMRDNTLFFSASKRITGSKYEKLWQILRLLRKLQSFSTVISNCFICCGWCPLLAITSSKL